MKLLKLSIVVALALLCASAEAGIFRHRASRRAACEKGTCHANGTVRSFRIVAPSGCANGQCEVNR